MLRPLEELLICLILVITSRKNVTFSIFMFLLFGFMLVLQFWFKIMLIYLLLDIQLYIIFPMFVQLNKPN